MPDIIKIGLAAFQGDHMLLTRKAGSVLFILPGGKPEAGEDDERTLTREIDEELGCQIDSFEGLQPLGTFTDVAADATGTVVHVRLYAGLLVGSPIPQSEIEEVRWVDVFRPGRLPMAPSLINFIIPYLARELASGRLAKWQHGPSKAWHPRDAG